VARKSPRAFSSPVIEGMLMSSLWRDRSSDEGDFRKGRVMPKGSLKGISKVLDNDAWRARMEKRRSFIAGRGRLMD